MTSSQNSIDKKKEQNKIFAFLKENIAIVVFVIINMIVATGLYFIAGVQEGIIKNDEEKITEEIMSINKALKKIEEVKGGKINLFTDQKKLNRYKKILDKFIENFGNDSLETQIGSTGLYIKKSFVLKKPDLNKVKDFLYWALANNIKINVISYPINGVTFEISVK